MLEIAAAIGSLRQDIRQAPPRAALQQRVLLFVSLTAAVIYLFALQWEPYQGQFLLKALVIAPLVGMPLPLKKAPRRWLLSLALFASLVGDVCLVLPGPDWFLRGLFAFLTTHLMYIYLFMRRTSWPLRLTVGETLGMVCIVVGVAIVLSWLWPKLGAMRLPVLLYGSALALVNISSLCARLPGVFAGTLLFLFSDSLLGITVFRGGPPGAALLISLTYYTAQLLIVSGYLTARSSRHAPPLLGG